MFGKDLIAGFAEKLGGSNHQIICSIESKNRKHTAYLIDFWNVYVQLTALFVNDRYIDSAVSISNVSFSKDSKKLNYDKLVVEDPAFEDWPDSREDEHMSCSFTVEK